MNNSQVPGVLLNENVSTFAMDGGKWEEARPGREAPRPKRPLLSTDRDQENWINAVELLEQCGRLCFLAFSVMVGFTNCYIFFDAEQEAYVGEQMKLRSLCLTRTMFCAKEVLK